MTNPLLAELNNLSPAAKTALAQAHAATAQPPPASLTPIMAPGAHPQAAPLSTGGPSKIPSLLSAQKTPEPAPLMPPMEQGAAPILPPAGLSVKAPRGTIQGDQAEQSRLVGTGSGISQIHSKIENALPNHPLLGKALGWAAQIPATLADVGASAVAPEITANLPGTEYHHERLVKQGQAQLGQDVGNAEKQAETGEAQARTGAIENPPDEITPIPTEQGYLGVSRKTGQANPITVNGQPAQPIEKPTKTDLRPEQVMGPDGKPMMANYDPSTGVYTDQSGKQIANAQPVQKEAESHVPVLGDDGKPTFANYSNGKWTDTQGKPIQNPQPIPPPPSYGQLMLPTKTITAMVNGIPTIMQWDEKTQAYDKPAAQSASGAYAHEEAQAGAVTRGGEQLIQDLQANKDKLGNLSAWVNKYGLNTPIADPKLAEIQAELSTFAALQPAMHGFRSHSALEAFNQIVGGLQKNPDATIASIRGILRTAGNINPSLQNGQEAQRPPNVPPGYVHKDSGPHGPGWYKP